jgi:phosphate transport system substrate-binding protein
MKKKLFSVLALIIALSLGASACSKPKTAPVADNQQTQIEQVKELIGAGATFPAPLYQKYFDVYRQQKGITVNYQGIGSGGGINQLIEKIVHFGGTDAPMRLEQIEKAGSTVLHVPACLGAVVVTYNLEGSPKLQFDADLLANIFMGKIRRWSDPAIAAMNPGVSLPDAEILVAFRSDGSGTTYTFADFLNKANPEWRDTMGLGTSLEWPVGIGSKGNDGVSGTVRITPNSIGYVELIYAYQNNLPYATIRNKSGNFIEPTLQSVSAAADVVLPDDLIVSLTDTDAPDGYPIATFSWMIAYREQDDGIRNLAEATATANMLWWVVTDAQQYNETLQYGKLSPAAVEKAKALIKSMTFNGKPILK